MADHLLAHGAGESSLRTLARAAGVSDRMLPYYFADKDEILRETLAAIAARLAAMLEAGAQGGGLKARAGAAPPKCRTPGP